MMMTVTAVVYGSLNFGSLNSSKEMVIAAQTNSYTQFIPEERDTLPPSARMYPMQIMNFSTRPFHGPMEPTTIIPVHELHDGLTQGEIFGSN